MYVRPDLVSKEIDRAIQSEPKTACEKVQLGESALGKARQVCSLLKGILWGPKRVALG